MSAESSSASEVPPGVAKPQNRGTSRRQPPNAWVLACIGGLGVHAIAIVLFQLRPLPPVSEPVRKQGIVWLRNQADTLDTVVGGQLALKDPTPIFLPTARNYSLGEREGISERRPGDVFEFREPTAIVDPNQSPPGLVVVPEGITSADVALRQFERPYARAFGRQDDEIKPVPARLAFLDVYDAGSGENVMSREVPATVGRSWPFWAPFEMFVRVERTGSLGPPLVPAPGSGSEELDEFLQRFVRFDLRMDLRLPAGYYRVTVRP